MLQRTKNIRVDPTSF